MNWMTSKVQGGDVEILLKLGGGAKLRDYIQTVYRKSVAPIEEAWRPRFPLAPGSSIGKQEVGWHGDEAKRQEDVHADRACVLQRPERLPRETARRTHRLLGWDGAAG